MTLHRLTPKIDTGFIAGLEDIVLHAKSGQLRGAIVLLNYATTYAHWQGGTFSFETAVTSLESWKWHQFKKRDPAGR